MPSFTISVSDRLLARLQAMTAAYNSNNGTSLSVKQWLKVEILRAATQDALGEYVQRRQEEIQAAGNQQLNNEAETERQRLSTEIS